MTPQAAQLSYESAPHVIARACRIDKALNVLIRSLPPVGNLHEALTGYIALCESMGHFPCVTESTTWIDGEEIYSRTVDHSKGGRPAKNPIDTPEPLS